MTVRDLVMAAAGATAPSNITFVASASTQTPSSGTTLTINKPTGTVDGDLMIAFMLLTSGSILTWTGDTGWTEVADQNQKPSLRVAYKIASSEGSSYTFTASNTFNQASGAILTYRGAVYDAIGSFANNSNPLVPTGPSAALNNSKLIAIIGREGVSQTYSDDSGLMTSRVVDNDATAPLYVAYDQTVNAGATGTKSFTNSGGNSTNSVAIMLTIKPA